ncbi:ATP-binding cassette domain-containing protein [Paenibacillus sp. 2003]|uniref:ATP-binding cassette domain-containing protein n=1 Tax=Paenibacillus TaxID=44249 RepID=UPI0028592407|nr:ATP-binding cassette domain-containing protein [Paenibacillus sp. 2003]MDR6716322.1 ABC-type multidrug transport system ATPase subunit [Paenibacillus sp. 2003]
MIWSARGLFKKSDQARPDSSGRVILLQQVSKRLGHAQVLNQINLEVKQGECAVLVGRNGSGKSTLLRILAGSLLPDTGSIHCTLKGSAKYAVDGLPRVPFTSGEYLWEMGRIRGIRPELLRERIRELSELLYLDTAIDQKLPLLSKGTLQKVNLIQALLPGPGGLLLLDEPLSGLDIPAQEAVVSLLGQWKVEGTSIVTACHEPLLIERLADQVVVLQKGRVLRYWSRKDLLQAGEPVVHIQSLMETEENLANDPSILKQPGVLSLVRNTSSEKSNSRMWDWKVVQQSTDDVLRMILASGGSIVSVQQEESQLHMESLLEGQHPAVHASRGGVTESVDLSSSMDDAGGEAE